MERAYLVTIEDNGAEWRAFACELDAEEAGTVRAIGEGAIALDQHNAWDAAKDALASAMPEPEEWETNS